MIYVKVENDTVVLSSSDEAKADGWSPVYQSRHDWETYGCAVAIADGLTKSTGELYIPTESPSSWPRYDVIKAPMVGDEVSKCFNGDYYPLGKIVSISKTMKKIVTEGGDFYRYKLTGQWVQNGTWSLIPGTIKELNPMF